ncbi:MAG: TonB-dependent receptor [Gemmatimonas sp.]
MYPKRSSNMSRTVARRDSLATTSRRALLVTRTAAMIAVTPAAIVSPSFTLHAQARSELSNGAAASVGATAIDNTRHPALFGPTVLGTVTDAAGMPLGSVEVRVTAVNRSTMTDDDGKFVLRALPPGSYHVDILRIGYAGQHIVVNVPADGADIEVKVVMTPATIRLSSVNVTATPTGTDPLKITQATVQLSGKELQRALGASVGQTLSNEPGMSTRFNGPVANAPVIRGLTGERVLVLQDGDRAGDLSSAAVDHLNAVDPSQAERMEVIRGAASLLYGNNALGGVVNVITNDIPTAMPSRISGFAFGQGESVTPGGVGSVGLSAPLGSKFAISARGGYRKFDEMRVGGGGTQANTNGSTANGTGSLAYISDNASVGVGFRAMEFEYGLPFAEGSEEIRLKGSRRQAVLKSTINTNSAALSTIRVDGTAQWYRHNEIEDTGEIGTRFALNTQTLNVTARTKTGPLSGAIGVQGFLRQYTPTGEEAFTPSANNNNVALFLYEELPLTRGDNTDHAPQLQFGARVDHFGVTTKPQDADEVDRFGPSTKSTFNNVSGSLGVSIPLNTSTSLTANVARGFRAPTVEELYANGFHAAVGTFDVGNPNLKPEQSTGMEAGVRAQNGKTFAQFNTYYNLISNYVLPTAVGLTEADGDSVPLVNFSQGNARMYGIEGQAETELVSHVVGGVMGDYTRATLKDGGNLPYIPAGRIGGSLRYDNGRLSFGGDAKRVFRQMKVSGDQLDVATDAYTLVNLSASWIFSGKTSTVSSLTVRADNLLDEQYRDAASRIKSFAFNPGRNLSVVYKILF